ncbi:hypothetical protein [Rhodanobacter sp. Soil772]|uniref:hypothetical protein n=1 Tax=Rhodanobacter sp. Soil772 TaxID=1736406 RepID=UPI001F272D62|nr:hypothetical protein [Rhodanobacter sp. Soil772]
MNRSVRYAVVAAAVMGLCGCAQQTKIVRPSATQLQALKPLPIIQVINQDKLAAEDTFTYANVSFIPNPSIPIVVGAAGGALGMAIVNAEIRAEARRFAEQHVQPLRTVLEGFDAKGVLSESLRQGLGQQPALFGSYTLADAAWAEQSGSGQRAVLETSYAMTPDFSALQVIATVSIFVPGSKDNKPLYRNMLVYQSPRFSVPAKTAADSEHMVAQENSRYAALHIDDEIEKANAAFNKHDPEAGRMRQKVVSEQREHRLRLKQAGEATWDPDTRAHRLCETWSAGHGEALKAAMRASGIEIAHMLQLDLAGQVPADLADQPHTVFQDDSREIKYLEDGHMISLAVSDDDASEKKSSPRVTMPLPHVGR